MSNHSLNTTKFDGAWSCFCECGSRSEPSLHKWEVEDWGIEHLAQVERVRAHLRDRNPGLRDQARWYRKQAQIAADARERTLWSMLAEGLEHRLGVKVEEQPLFEENA